MQTKDLQCYVAMVRAQCLAKNTPKYNWTEVQNDL